MRSIQLIPSLALGLVLGLTSAVGCDSKTDDKKGADAKKDGKDAKDAKDAKKPDAKGPEAKAADAKAPDTKVADAGDAKAADAKAGEPAPADAGAPKNIVETAVAAGNFKTLATALEKADLIKTLSGEGPFTVFAPTDEAFAKVPKEALDALLAKPEDLKAVLLMHVVAGKVMAADAAKLKEAETVGGTKQPIDATDGVKFGGAKVVTADIAASNGVIHVIDTVIRPAAPAAK
jgi:uncharacterized surface protein with fasciclin (FAS1) repeats